MKAVPSGTASFSEQIFTKKTKLKWVVKSGKWYNNTQKFAGRAESRPANFWSYFKFGFLDFVVTLADLAAATPVFGV